METVNPIDNDRKKAAPIIVVIIADVRVAPIGPLGKVSNLKNLEKMLMLEHNNTKQQRFKGVAQPKYIEPITTITKAKIGKEIYSENICFKPIDSSFSGLSLGK